MGDVANAVPDELMIMDSGASKSHITSKTNLTGYNATTNAVHTANGAAVQSVGVGTLGNLSGVSHTPSFVNNLLSVAQLADLGYNCTFTKLGAEIRCAVTGVLKATGKRVGNLYLLDVATVKALPNIMTDSVMYVVDDNQANLSSTKPTCNLDTLHSRTHLSDHLLRELSNRGLVDGVKLIKSDFYRNPSICPACAMCKMTRRSFKKDSHREIPGTVFSHFYSDVEGPIKPTARDGIKYMVVFACARSRFRTIYFMRTKDEVTEKLQVFKSQCVDAYGFKISEILSDGGGEYIGEFFDFCIDNAIVSNNTSPHTPEENGAEVYWRTLMGMTRAFFKNSSLPYTMWPWAAKHANYVLNRTLIVNIDGVAKTPYEWRFNVRPSLKNLRVWGCELFYKVHGHVLKLEDRGSAGFYLGIDNNSRSVIVFDKDTGKLRKSGHVLFNEVIQSRSEVDGAASESSAEQGVQEGESLRIHQ